MVPAETTIGVVVIGKIRRKGVDEHDWLNGAHENSAHDRRNGIRSARRSRSSVHELV